MSACLLFQMKFPSNDSHKKEQGNVIKIYKKPSEGASINVMKQNGSGQRSNFFISIEGTAIYNIMSTLYLKVIHI